MPDANCTKCGGTGWRIVERAGLSGAERCECGGAERAVNLKERANIPPNFRGVSLDNFQIPQDNPIARQGLGTVLMQVRSFVREFPAADHPGLLLIGEPGTGKTHLAVAAMKALLDKGHECVFFNFQNLLQRVRQGWDAGSGTSDREAYRTALDAEVLLLDDLGAHRLIEWVEDTITAIITHRCDQKKPLIATTNLPDEERLTEFAMPSGDKKTIRSRTLAETIGSRARSRLFEMCRVVRMPAVEDYRVKRSR
jgi:DNA replication protein DnaC